MSACSSETYSIDPHYICGICMDKFPITCLYTCDRGHLVCTRCYKQEYYIGKDIKCPYKYCNCWMSKANKQSDDCLSGFKKMFPCPWEVCLSKKLLENPKRSFCSIYRMGESDQSLTALSRKPVFCPYYSCNKTIAVTTFYEHFRYEHPSVTFLDTKFETRNGLNFHLDDIRYNERHCILLIKMINGGVTNLKTGNSSLSEDKILIPSSKPALLVMAIRIHSFDTPFDNDNLSSGDADEDSSTYDLHACTPDDRILIWIASNVATKYSYTLAVSTLCNEIRLKYYGQMLTMNEDPLKMCSEGRGLILSNYHIKGMTGNGTKPLVMDIIIHKEILDENDPDNDNYSCWEGNGSGDEILENLF